MFAIVQTGGKQYKVEKGQTVKVEKLDAKVGSKIKLDVLMLSDEKGIVTGNPVAKSYAECEILAQGKGEKVIVYKYKAKKNSRKKQGHRQPYTAIKVLDIVKG